MASARTDTRSNRATTVRLRQMVSVRFEPAFAVGVFAIARLVRRLRRREAEAHVLLVAPGMGNIGDQAMVESYLHNVQGPKILIARRLDDARVDPDRADVEVKVIPRILYFSLRDFAHGVISLFTTMRDARSFSVIGADIMDGAYNDSASARRFYLASAAATVGVPARILGFSWNQHPSWRAARAVGHASPRLTLCARDPESASRLRPATRAHVREVVDLAFALPVEASVFQDLTWVEDEVSSGRPVVAVNLNSLVERQTSQVGSFSRLSAYLIDRGWSVIAIPHDPRHDPSDHDLAMSLREMVDSSHCRVSIEGLSPQQVKSIVSRASLVVSARMHLAILSLSTGTPTVSVSYQGKVEGLYRRFGMDANWVAPDEQFDENLQKIGRRVARDADHYSEVVKSALPSIQAMAMENFAGLAR